MLSNKDAMEHVGGSAVGVSFVLDPYGLESKDQFLLDHAIDGRKLFPFTGFMVLAWKTLAKLERKQWKQMPVLFENLTVHRAVILRHGGGEEAFLL